MAIRMEDLPVGVQEELRDLRTQMAESGWDLGTHATVLQWREYYARLSPRAQEFLVDNLLEAAQRGSTCLQADHQSAIDASWGQLMEVVKLHNARVTEAEMLRRRLDFLEGRAPSGPSSEEILAEVEKVLNPPVIVDMTPGREEQALFPDKGPEFIEVGFENTPADRRLYVVKDPPGGQDGG